MRTRCIGCSSGRRYMQYFVERAQMWREIVLWSGTQVDAKHAEYTISNVGSFKIFELRRPLGWVFRAMAGALVEWLVRRYSEHRVSACQP